jgi:TetR/AcrR family transcriptional regulator
MFAWSGLQYSGPEQDPDRNARSRMLGGSVDELRAQAAGRLPPRWIRPACR